MHRVEPVKGLLLQRTARAALPVVEPDQHKGQRCGELEQKQQRARKALPEDAPLDGRSFFAAANAGEPEALEVLRRFCHAVAVQIYNLTVLLDVEKVAIGGGISAAEALLPAIQAELDWLFERCTVMPTVKPELVRCRYGNDANLIGALKLFFEQNPA